MPKPTAFLEKACRRLNPGVALDVDVIAVVSGAIASTAAEWTAGTGDGNTVVDSSVNAPVILLETGSVDIFKSPGVSGTTDRYHWVNLANTNGGERLWLDFWPNPAILGPNGFTLHSLDLVLGRKDSGHVFGSIGFSSNTSMVGGKYIVEIARIDSNFNREIVGSPVEILCTDVALSPTLFTLNFRNRLRTLTIRTGRQQHRTGSGRTSFGGEQTFNVFFEGDDKVSHLDLNFGFSVGISLYPAGAGYNAQGASLGMVPTGTAAGFDTTTFWRSCNGTSDARDCGPFSPDAKGTVGTDTTKNPGYGFLSTGAVPGYGAIDTIATISGNVVGKWGVSREVGVQGKPQTGIGQEANAWHLPWHVLRAVQYAVSGTRIVVLDLGHTPTYEVHFRSDTIEPTGTSVGFTIRGSNTSSTGPWTPLTAFGPNPYDGSVFGPGVSIPIQNADFEASASIPPPGWTADRATLSYETVGQFAGTRSLRVDSTSQFGNAQSPKFPVTPGEVYSISTAMKSLAGVQADAQLAFWDINNVYLGGIQPVTTSGTYVTVSGSGVAPINAVTGQIFLQCNTVGTGSVFFDNIVVTRGGALYRWYEVTATLNSSSDRLTTPSLVAISMTERIRFATFPYSMDVDSTSSIDPVTGQSSIGELKLPLLHGGRKDFRDIVTQISSNYSMSSVEAWVYARETISGRRYFLNLYRLEDRDPQDGSEDLVFVSGMDRLTVLVPPAMTTFQYPSDSSLATISSFTYNAGTRELRVTTAGTPYSVDISNMRVTFYGGILDRTNWKIVSSPAPSSSAFSIILEDTTQQPSNGDAFKIYSDVTTRQEVVYSGQDFATIYSDILTNQAAVPQRYRGKVPAATTRLGTGRLIADGVIARTPLQDIGLHCQGGIYWGQGRINFIDLYSPRDSVAIWNERDYVDLKTPTGYNRRMPSIDVKYGFDYVTGKFANETIFNDANAVLALGRANLFDVTNLSDSLCKWNDVNEGPFIAQMLLAAWSMGVRIWTVTLAMPHPWVDFGDGVTISTDQYTDHRPNIAADGITDTGTPIAGRISAFGVIVGKNLLGTEFLVALNKGLSSIINATGGPGTTATTAAPLTCPAITLSFIEIGASAFFKLPSILITFTAPTSAYYDRMEFKVQAASDTAGTSVSAKTSPARVGCSYNLTYTITPTVISITGQATVGTAVAITIPNNWRIGRQIPYTDPVGTDDGYAIKSTTTDGLNAHSGVQHSGGKLINHLYFKPNVSDPDTADSILRGSTLGIPKITAQDGSGNIDFSGSGYVNKNVDNVADGSTYGRPILGRLSSGKPWIDFSEGIHSNKDSGNIARSGGDATAVSTIIQNVTNSGHAGSAMQESGGKAINKLFAKVNASDVDTLGSVADDAGGTWRKITSVNSSNQITPPSSASRNRCKLKRTGTLTVPDVSVTVVDWNTEVYDSNSLHDNSTNNSRITVPTGGNTGAWFLTCTIEWSGNTGGAREIQIRKNGSGTIAQSDVQAFAATAQTRTLVQTISGLDDAPSVGDYYEVYVFQDSGSSVTIITTNDASRFAATHLW